MKRGLYGLLPTVLVVVFATVLYAQNDEADLIAVLRSDAPKSEKAITCKKLAVHGSEDAVAVLAELLPDPELTSWARTALEVIPGPEADEALRNAAGVTDGRTRVGILHSVGVRRDVQAVGLLEKFLKSEDAATVDAAAVALGRIGTSEAATALEKALTAATKECRAAMAPGCVIAAESLRNAGRMEEAISLYDAVRSADVPAIRKIEAIRGAI
ncbi:MAG: HEAT repeat domain-containing protein, partial [Planctomycetia bacterium]|nr:HEAT repeat domain-containing protein [Planctomycetia bacterium]